MEHHKKEYAAKVWFVCCPVTRQSSQPKGVMKMWSVTSVMGFSSSPQEAFQSQAAVTFWSIPVILGMPSNLGTGRVIIKPWAVPTHSSPWQMRRLVTRMLFWPAALETHWHRDWVNGRKNAGRLHEIIETATDTERDHPSWKVNNELLLILISPSFFQDNSVQKWIWSLQYLKRDRGFLFQFKVHCVIFTLTFLA